MASGTELERSPIAGECSLIDHKDKNVLIEDKAELDEQSENASVTTSIKSEDDLLTAHTSKNYDAEILKHKSFRKNNKRRHSANENSKTKTRKISSEDFLLVNRFLIGGNISDPLNLKGQPVEGAKPENRPETVAPEPLRNQRIDVRKPANLEDPLRLYTKGPMIDDGKKKKKKRRVSNKEIQEEKTDSCDLDVIINENYSTTAKKDPIVSPAVRQSFFRTVTSKMAKKRTNQLRIEEQLSSKVSNSSEGGSSKITQKGNNVGSDNKSSKVGNVKQRQTVSSAAGVKSEAGRSGKKAAQKVASPVVQSAAVIDSMVKKINFRAGNAQYKYGNYSRYYGYRCSNKFSDGRMQCFNKMWFKDKDVLDVGCNSGQLTLLIARDFSPRKIVGVDIDEKLISAARSNIRHYATSLKRISPTKTMPTSANTYPKSFSSEYGSLTGPPLETGTGDSASFPNNVFFHAGNYVPETPVALDVQEPEYDVIMCLSVTKWLHLNWGDEGLKRTFARMYKQLRPGGKLIIEPQDWKSYGKKKKTTETIFRNYHSIKLRPDAFSKYLVDQVGFVGMKTLKFGDHDSSSGFQRPILLFSKPQ